MDIIIGLIVLIVVGLFVAMALPFNFKQALADDPVPNRSPRLD